MTSIVCFFGRLASEIAVLSQLAQYYDYKTSDDEFSRMFGELAIVKDRANWRSNPLFKPSESRPTPECRTFTC